LIKISNVPEFKPFKIPLKFLTFLSQMQNILSLDKLYEKANTSLKVNNNEKPFSIEEFKSLLKRTEKWISEVKNIISRITDQRIKRNFLNKIDIFNIPDAVSKDLIDTLSDKQLEGLCLFKTFLLEHENLDVDSIQNKIFTIAKEELDIPPRKMFEAFYLLLLGNKSGPRLGPFILMLDKEWLLKRLNQLED